ncbi:hypothetical protein INT43_003783 [Umbelopsis isabellina]|uniref:Uncharacterized protein n=1 Tax=Mortierella isabellina TaxID=91625 RepID=A0A8H7PTU7_MORIS|nr:hypothetical protein INT43_003783 [Umbelopsis isabellina]
MIGHTPRHFANKRKPSSEPTPEKSVIKLAIFLDLTRPEPNRLAQYAKILEKQYRCLSNTTSNLEEELQQLKQVLEQDNDKLENERWEVLAELEMIKHNMPHLSSENHLTTLETQGLDERGSEESEKQGCTQLDELQERIIQSCRAQLASEIELEAQNGAIKALEKDLQKVNGLPQILPILRSSIKDCEQAVKKHRDTVSNLEDTRLLSVIKDYTKQQLRTSASEREMKKIVHKENKHDAYDEVIDVLLEQAAIEQLFLYIMELEEEKLKLVTDHQEALLLDNKVAVETADALQYQQVRECTKKTEQMLLDNLEKILNFKHSNDIDILENLEGGGSNTPITIVNRLEKLQLDDRAARNRTEASITSMNKLMVDSYTAVEKAEGYASLYYKNQDSNGLTPAAIIQTQAQLETLVEVLQSEIQHYQKVSIDRLLSNIITVNSELAEKKRRFALFWTDQQQFEQEFGRMRSSQP